MAKSERVTHWFAWTTIDWSAEESPEARFQTGSLGGSLTGLTLTLDDWSPVSNTASCAWGKRLDAREYCATEAEAVARLVKRLEQERDRARDDLASADAALRLARNWRPTDEWLAANP